MKRFPSMLVVVLGLSAMVAGCAAPPPRAAYYDRDGYRASARVCGPCGYIEDIERVSAADRGTSGAGAVIGAIVGGVLGNTVGHGRGRRAATVGGAVAGGFAGNAIERNSNDRDANAWRFYIGLDDGRNAVVTQYDNPGLRRGDRVAIRGDRVVLLR